MPELTREERLARALTIESDAEQSKQLTREERLKRALEESEDDDKKKSQSQSGSSTEKSSLGTSEQKKEQSSGTGEVISLEEKKRLARERKSKNIDWQADEETTSAF